MENFVIRNDVTGKYIAIDSKSGGYPYDTDLLHAEYWVDIDKAMEYINMFKDNTYSLHRLIIYTDPHTIKVEIPDLLKSLDYTDKLFTLKVKLLADMLCSPNVRILCPGELVNWCKSIGLKTENVCEDGSSWWSVSLN